MGTVPFQTKAATEDLKEDYKIILKSHLLFLMFLCIQDGYWYPCSESEIECREDLSTTTNDTFEADPYICKVDISCTVSEDGSRIIVNHSSCCLLRLQHKFCIISIIQNMYLYIIYDIYIVYIILQA